MDARKIEWITESGLACVAISFATTKKVFADGDECDAACCELRISAEVDEEDFELAGKELLSANSDERVPIPAAQLAEIEAALAAIYATPEWQAKEAAKANAAKANADYAAHREKMRQVMWY